MIPARSAAAQAAAARLAGARLTACAGGATPASPPSDSSAETSAGLDELAKAIDLVNGGRRTTLSHVATVIAGLERRDDVDDLAAAGERSGARTADVAADAAYGKSLAALRDLGASLTSFQRGLDTLATAALSPELDAAQRRLLGTAVAHGRTEVSVTRDFAAAVRSAVPAYDALGARLDEWLRRARAGWYRDSTEAANAYVVLVGDVRAALESGRGALSRADAARTAAVAATTRSFTLARRALAPLTTRPTNVPGSPSELPA